MRSIEIKLYNPPKASGLFFFAFLLLGCVILIKPVHAQDIPNTEEIKAVIAASPKKKIVGSAAKAKEVKPKAAAVAFKNSAPQTVKSAPVKTKAKNTTKELKTESYAVIPVSENNSATARINGTVRLKQLNRGAAGVLIEAIRADTREMIDSAETNAAGEYGFSKLPTGITLIFLVSSEKTKPLIFQTAIATGMKNLDFSVLPK